MTRILVTGASGLLGLNLSLQLYDRCEIIGVTHRQALNRPPFKWVEADLARPGKVAELVNTYEPDLVVHCAALANVDACEGEPGLALRVNGELPGEMAAVCRRMGTRLVHLSTDAVFDGQRGGYVETDEPNPLNVYARTKLAGEHAVADANPDALVLRVNFYGLSLSGKRSLAELFHHNLSAGREMMGFTDVFFCPLQVNDLVDLILKMGLNGLNGLYHVVSSECISKYDFGMAIARRFGLDGALIRPVSWREAGLKAVRSPNLTLNVEKATHALGSAMPDQAAGLERLFENFQENLPERLRSLAQPVEF